MKNTVTLLVLTSLVLFGCVEQLDSLEKSLEGKMVEKPECNGWIQENCVPTPLPAPPGSISADEFRQMMDSIPERNKRAQEIEASFYSFVPNGPQKVTNLDECEAFLEKQYAEAKLKGKKINDENRWYNFYCSGESLNGAFPAKAKTDEITVTNFQAGTKITKQECLDKYAGKEYRQDRKMAGCIVKKTTCLEEKTRLNVEEFKKESPKASNEEVQKASEDMAKIYCQLNEAFEKSLKEAEKKALSRELGISENQIFID